MRSTYNIVVILLFMLFTGFVNSQDSGETVGKTFGGLSVSLTGASIYKVPFTLPSGINGMIPNLGLVYNSQMGEGIAGWGWNLYGISTITRAASTIDKDGSIEPVDFNYNDKYLLDGERLLRSQGEYGDAIVEYVTEGHSKIKVLAYENDEEISGPERFKVFYPDGTISEYRNHQRLAFLEWHLIKKTDPQGNYISYSHFNSGGLSWIKKISYGGNILKGTPHIVEVHFNYEEDGKRVLRSQSYYVHYSKDFREQLESIRVNLNGKLYRYYSLQQHYNKYVSTENLVKIVEYNSKGKSLPPINFSYSKSSTNDISRTYLNIRNRDFDRGKYQSLTGDFNGDGREDFITYFKNQYNRYEADLYTGMFDKRSKVKFTQKFAELSSNGGLFATRYLTKEGEVSQSQGILSVREKDGDELWLTTYDKNFNRVHFIEYSQDKNSSSNSDCKGKSISRKFFSGDFNGDGITDIMAVPVLETDCDKANIRDNDIYYYDLYNGKKKYVATKSIGKDDRFYAADYTGDGKTDMIHIVDGKIYVHDLNASGYMRHIITITDDNIKKGMPIFLGNFNTDSKVDFVMPTANGSDKWHFIISGGSHGSYLSKYVEQYTEEISGLKYYEHYTDNNNVEHNYLVRDFNGDGKDDMLWHQLRAGDSRGASNHTFELFSSDRLGYINSRMLPTFYSFYKKSFSTSDYNGSAKRGIYFFIDNELCHATMDRIHNYNFAYNHNEETKLIGVENNGVNTGISYKSIREDNAPYTKGYGQKYPYYNMNDINYHVVDRVTEISSGQTKYKDYQYESLVTHLRGLGFMGFETVKMTNWYGDGVEKLWTINKQDMSKRGATVKKVFSLSDDIGSVSSILEQTDFTYLTKEEGDLFINYPIKVVKRDMLRGFTYTDEYTLDSYYNTTKAVSIYAGGSKTITYEYSNNASSSDNTYHIGRVLNQQTVSVQDGDSRNSGTRMSYANNLVTKLERQGHNTGWLTETFTYDEFGNILSSTTSGEGVSARTEQYEYDTTGRYVVKATDIEGLVTENNYNDAGVMISSKDPYGFITTYEYDGWQRLIKEVDYLGNASSIIYSKSTVPGVSGECIVITQVDASGGSLKKYYNTTGLLVQESKLDLNDKWVNKRYEYDIAGKSFRESSPYFGDSSPSQWVIHSYDDYGRLVSSQLPTGKVISRSYNGSSTTISDGVETTTQRMDALGNVEEVVDQGGSITYGYYGSGQMRFAKYGSHTVTVDIDGWGRKVKMVDPSAGTYTYSYNSYGELLNETTPKGETRYIYDGLGKLIEKESTGDNTAMKTNYFYNGTTKLLSKIEGVDEGDSAVVSSYTYNYAYDNYQRLSSVEEVIGDKANFKKVLTYDGLGRVDTEQYESTSGTISSNVKVKRVFGASSGQYKELRDAVSNDLLWSISDVNARGQSLKVGLGNGLDKTRDYDNYGYLKSLKDSNSELGSVLEVDYVFDTQRGNLTSREVKGLNRPWKETFSYDGQDRLTNVAGPKAHTMSYDNRGRISENGHLGKYSYRDGSLYQLESINLNSSGDLYYKTHKQQDVDYNVFKQPVSVHEQGKGRLDFSYGPMGGRSASYYGGEEADREQRDYVKYYSSIIPVEIVKSKSGKDKVLTYLGGDAYTASVVHLEERSSGTTSNGYYYLHRNYLGSVLAITDSNMEIVERRQFGAWGSVDLWVDGSFNNIVDGGLLSGRGYTGHEHFESVSLIHMNGRMYDAKLGRFLSPDNYIQEPYSTKSFNRYSYVWNNPLTYNDPSGEIVFTALAAFFNPTLLPMAIQTDIGWITGGLSSVANGGSFGEGALVGGLLGAANGALSMISPLNLPLGNSGIGLSIAPQIALGTDGLGLGFNATFGYDLGGGFTTGVNIGGTYYASAPGTGNSSFEGRIGYGIGFENKNLKAGIGTTYFLSGETSQQTGQLYGGGKNWKLTYDNDTWAPVPGLAKGGGPSKDKFRTSAVKLDITGGKYKGFNAGFNIFTGHPNNDSYEEGPNGTFDGPDADKYRLGVLYFGYGNMRLGYNSERNIRGPIQNTFHDIFKYDRFRVLPIKDRIYMGIYTSNPYTLW